MREDINLKCLKSGISPCTLLTHPVLPGSPDACQRALLVFAHANLLYSGRSGFVQDHTANKTWDSSMELSDCVAQALNPSLLMRDQQVVTLSSTQGFLLMQLDTLEHNVTATVLDTCSAQGSFLLYSHSPVYRHLGCFWFGPIIHTVAMNIFLQWCLNGIGSWGYEVY